MAKNNKHKRSQRAEKADRSKYNKNKDHKAKMKMSFREPKNAITGSLELDGNFLASLNRNACNQCELYKTDSCYGRFDLSNCKKLIRK